jgi:hypothetical protein
MHFLAQNSVTYPAPVVVKVYHWGHIAIAGGGALLILILLALVLIFCASRFSRIREKAKE